MTTAKGTATTWGQTFKLDDLRRLERELAAMPRPLWTLIGPDGRVWQSAEPHELLAVLAGACYPLLPAGVSARPHQSESPADADGAGREA